MAASQSRRMRWANALCRGARPTTASLMAGPPMPEHVRFMRIDAAVGVQRDAVNLAGGVGRHIALADVAGHALGITRERIAVAGAAHGAQLDDVARADLEEAVQLDAVAPAGRALDAELRGRRRAAAADAARHRMGL